MSDIASSGLGYSNAGDGPNKGVPAFLVPGNAEQRVFQLPVLRREFSNPFCALRDRDWLGSLLRPLPVSHRGHQLTTDDGQRVGKLTAENGHPSTDNAQFASPLRVIVLSYHL